LLEILHVFIQFERRDEIVVVILQRIGDGTLVAVIRRQVKHIVELIGQLSQDAIISDGSFDQLDARVA